MCIIFLLKTFNDSDQLRILEKSFQNDYINLLRCEKDLWHLKSRISWLLLEDRNTKFFHKFALIKRRKNKINQLLNNENTWIFNPQDIGAKLRSSPMSTLGVSPSVLSPNQNYLNLLPKLIEEESLQLCHPSDHLEIKTTL